MSEALVVMTSRGRTRRAVNYCRAFYFTFSAALTAGVGAGLTGVWPESEFPAVAPESLVAVAGGCSWRPLGGDAGWVPGCGSGVSNKSIKC